MESKKSTDLPFESHYVSSWDKLRSLYYEEELSVRNKEKHWVFRAEKRPQLSEHREHFKLHDCRIEEDSYFQTSLDKAFASFKPDEIENGKCYTRLDLENALIREFQRKAHHHLMYVPKKDNTIEWLTLMQHYGGPTRFLDWTYSFYVAIFFALTRLNCDIEYAEVWATNAKWMEKVEEKICTTKKLKNLSQLRKKDPINMDKYHNAILDRLFKRPQNLVINLNSFRLNNRIINQQGTFLVQGNISISFDDNLKGTRGLTELKKNLHRIVIYVTKTERNTILQDLYRMNINNSTLFPGLQGFTESLATQLAYPEKFGLCKKNCATKASKKVPQRRRPRNTYDVGK